MGLAKESKFLSKPFLCEVLCVSDLKHLEKKRKDYHFLTRLWGSFHPFFFTTLLQFIEFAGMSLCTALLNSHPTFPCISI